MENLENDQLYKIRHSAAHVMAQAVLELFPDAKLSIGPPIENGFYYDFDLGVSDDGKPRSFTPDDLEKIEKRMRRIVGGKHEFVYREVSADEARELFKDQPYKLELIDGLAKGEVDEYGAETDEAPVISTFRQDTFEDLCRGPHIENTGKIRPDAFKLLSVAGAYWRGDENNPMLQRIYGTAWNSKSELKQHLQMLEEAKKRDHRKLGKELKTAGIRAQADLGNDRMNAKIRQAQLMKTPYMLIVGDREIENNSVSLRKRDGSRQNGMPTEEFIALTRDRIATRSDQL